MDGRLVLSSSTGVSSEVAARAFSQLQNIAGGVDAPITISEMVVKIQFAGDRVLNADAFSWASEEQVDANIVLMNQPAPKLFVADMDSTMIGQECIDELADYAGVKAQIAEITEMAMQGKLDFEAALRERVALLKGLDVAVLQQCYDERIEPNAGAKELLERLGHAGIRRVLVSGGFTFFASKIAEKLGFDYFEANEFNIENGKLTGLLNGQIVDRAHKETVLRAECVALGVDADTAIAIGDGANDLDMINASGFGVAYKAKPALEADANICLRYSHLNALADILEI